MAYAVSRLPSVEEAKERLMPRGLVEMEVYKATGNQVHDGTYVVDFNFEPESWIVLLTNGYRFDFKKAYVRLVPSNGKEENT